MSVATSNPDKRSQFADLSGYSFKKRLMIRAADLCFYSLIKSIGSTIRYEVTGWDNWLACTSEGRLPIYTFWHEGIILSTHFWRRRDIVVMTSQSFDGEYIARFIQRFGYGAARGSSTRGGIGALVDMIRAMREGKPAAFTIDGPKGPARVAKLGAVLLAKKSGQPILPFCVTPARYLELKSWDRLRIPAPFTRARVDIGPPLLVPADASDSSLEDYRLRLQATLDELQQRGEQWRRGKGA
jgi:hypothetical protein